VHLLGMVSQSCFGHHYAHHQENKTKPTNRLRCTALAVLQQTRGDEVARCALVGDGFHPQQVHTELPHLLQSVAARPVLYTVGDLSALSCSPDDGLTMPETC
jgi:hypothetical protein